MVAAIPLVRADIASWQFTTVNPPETPILSVLPFMVERVAATEEVVAGEAAAPVLPLRCPRCGHRRAYMIKEGVMEFAIVEEQQVTAILLAENADTLKISGWEK